jgi:hypothetical protein
MIAAAVAFVGVTTSGWSMAADGGPKAAVPTAKPAPPKGRVGDPRGAPEPPAARPAALRGAIVVGIGPTARAAAKALARLVYSDPALRASIDDATARMLVGELAVCTDDERAAAQTGQDAAGAPGADAARTDPLALRTAGRCTAALREIRDTVGELAAGCAPGCESWAVSRQLLAGLGLDLGAELVVTVETARGPDPEQGVPVARVLRVAERRFAPVQLDAQQAGGHGQLDWSGSLPVLRALLSASTKPSGSRADGDAGPAPTKSTTVRRTGASAPAAVPAEPDEPTRVLSSPWFWGGLGVLVAAGVTVFAVSRSSLSSAGTVQLDGRVSP